jgi:transposase
LAALARGRLAPSSGRWRRRSPSISPTHHCFLLGRIDALDADITALETKIEEMVAPFALAVDKLDEIPRVGTTAADVILAEIGLDMSRFPTATDGPTFPSHGGSR